MNKVKLNIFVDIFASIAFLFSAISGLILKFFLPRGSGKLGQDFINISREIWLSIHDISSIIFIILVLLHLIFHWRWILNIPKMIKHDK